MVSSTVLRGLYIGMFNMLNTCFAQGFSQGIYTEFNASGPRLAVMSFWPKVYRNCSLKDFCVRV